ncbi:hypothetical protein V6N13_043509 [Hibiscus sabdariffa]|uniref:ATPase F1/V1/A1 complex alpha/beta subunit N-terminal domain-containing protein n=1 Tax=Hibiscus sabdariffa TaxID=183260 RepID=A0ABR2G1C4_9ROSI
MRKSLTLFAISLDDYKVLGPVVYADGMVGTAMNELVCVGHNNQNSESNRLKGDFIIIQVYEETTDLLVKDPQNFCGVFVQTLVRNTIWNFQPEIRDEKDLLTLPDLYATLFENSLLQNNDVLPHDVMAKNIIYIAFPSQYSIKGYCVGT